MKNCKKIMLMLAFFYTASGASLWAQEFKAVDLDRLLRNHPVTARYDAETGRFKDTPSEIMTTQELQKSINSLQQDIESYETKRAELINKSLVAAFDKENEESLWESIREVDGNLQKAKDALVEKKSLLGTGGTPGIDKVHAVIRGIFADVRQQYSGSEQTIILNRLPVYIDSTARQKYGTDNLSSFFYKRSDVSLLNYLQQSYNIGMLFSITVNPIVYQKRNGDE